MSSASAETAPLVNPPDPENAVRVVWALAWPAVTLNSMQVVNTLLDRFFIGHLPAAALTAHGGATSVMFLMFSFAVALATGATAIVSRAYGAKDDREIREAADQSLRLAIGLGVVIGAITFFLAPYAARGVLPSTATEAIRQMTAFCRLYALGLPAIFVVQSLAGSLRGIGDTKSPMTISGIQIAIHIALNFLFIQGFGWGLSGAAAALSLSAWASAIGYLFFVRSTPLAVHVSPVLPGREWAARVLRIAMPAAFMAILRVGSLTAFTLVLALTKNGEIAIGAMTTGFAIESVMFMPAFGLSTAAGALVGQSLGMKRPDRAERLAWTSGHLAAGITLALCGPMYFLSEPVARLLLADKPEMIALAATLLRYLCVTEVFFAYAMVMIGAMQGAGDTVRPMWISVICLWGLRVPLAAIFALGTGQPLFGPLFLPFGLAMGATGAWLSMAVTQGLQGLLSLWLFKRGDWKTARV